MNAFENFFCSSSLWRYMTRRQLLPWLLSGTNLGDQLLEIGAGYGAATAYLQTRVSRVSSLEYDHKSTLKLKAQMNGAHGAVVRGDAARLPFTSQTFSSAIAILVLHHIKSAALQDRVFAEVFRVLRPGGVFLAFEIADNWIHRVAHMRSTFTPVAPASVSPRLSAAGFSQIALNFHKGAFRITATRL